MSHFARAPRRMISRGSAASPTMWAMAYRSVKGFLEVVLCTPHRRRAALVALLTTELTILVRYAGW